MDPLPPLATPMLPICEIASESPRFVKPAVGKLSDVEGGASVSINQRPNVVWHNAFR